MILGAGTISYKEVYFSKTEIFIQNKKFEYYLSPLLSKHKFQHAYFTKSSSEKSLELLGNHFNENYVNCVSNQIHSNEIIFGSHSQKGIKVEADGIFGDKRNQNLWVYTADCMPIFFADKRTRNVAAIHCGRKGLEKKIIKNIIKFFHNAGSYRNDLLVAIGPAIKKEHYTVDEETLKEFYKKAHNKKLTADFTKTGRNLHFNDLNNLEEQHLNQLDLTGYAYKQILNENIPDINIDISSLCTYELKNEFNSWRRSKTISRQWNLICSK